MAVYYSQKCHTAQVIIQVTVQYTQYCIYTLRKTLSIW